MLEETHDRNFVGTAYHKVYQYVNYDATREQIRETIDVLVTNCQIDRQFADKLDVELIYKTLHNEKLRHIMSQGEVRHEVPFMLMVPYNQVSVDKRFFDDVMLQGVIDLLILGENCAYVVDFKYTSRSEKTVKESYRAQLNSYRLAVQTICKVDNVECYVLSIADNKLIPMDE